MDTTMASMVPEVEENSPFNSSTNDELGNTTLGSSPGRTRRRLKIIRTKNKNVAPPKALKHMYVTRKPKEGEALTLASPTLDTLSYESDSPRDVYARGLNGEVLKHSILGSVDELQQFESQLDGESLESTRDTTGNRTPLSKTARIASFRSPLTNRSGRSTTGGNRSARQSSAPLPRNVIPDPTTDREGYMQMLEECARRAKDVRQKETAAEKVRRMHST